jgi:hypothetical protein
MISNEETTVTLQSVIHFDFNTSFTSRDLVQRLQTMLRQQNPCFPSPLVIYHLNSVMVCVNWLSEGVHGVFAQNSDSAEHAGNGCKCTDQTSPPSSSFSAHSAVTLGSHDGGPVQEPSSFSVRMLMNSKEHFSPDVKHDAKGEGTRKGHSCCKFLWKGMPRRLRLPRVTDVDFTKLVQDVKLQKIGKRKVFILVRSDARMFFDLCVFSRKMTTRRHANCFKAIGFPACKTAEFALFANEGKTKT